MISAISGHLNGKPDRLPCQVHNWMMYYLKTFLGGIDQYEAYERFGMDAVIYVYPAYEYNERDLSIWNAEHKELGQDADGNWRWEDIIKTPDGVLTQKGARNEFTQWTTEYLIKSQRDFDIWNKYLPLPEKVDWTPVKEAKQKIGKNGIVRCSFFDFGQGEFMAEFL